MVAFAAGVAEALTLLHSGGDGVGQVRSAGGGHQLGRLVVLRGYLERPKPRVDVVEHVLDQGGRVHGKARVGGGQLKVKPLAADGERVVVQLALEGFLGVVRGHERQAHAAGRGVGHEAPREVECDARVHNQRQRDKASHHNADDFCGVGAAMAHMVAARSVLVVVHARVLVRLRYVQASSIGRDAGRAREINRLYERNRQSRKKPTIGLGRRGTICLKRRRR